MKKIILGLFMALVALFSSCQSDSSVNYKGGEQTFSLSINDNTISKATLASLPSHYVIELYKLSSQTAAVSGDPVYRIEQYSDQEFTLSLDDDSYYSALVWADYDEYNAGNELVYNTDDLKQVSIDGQPTSAAFSGSLRFYFDVQDAPVYYDIALTHAVAQVNFVQSEVFTADDNVLSVEFANSYSVNVDDNSISSLGESVTYSFDDIDIGAVAQTIASSYIIAVADDAETVSTTEQTVMSLKSTFNSEVVKELYNIPFTRNYQTNITGSYSDLYNTVISVDSQSGFTASFDQTLETTVDYVTNNEVSNCYIVALSGINQSLEIPIGGRINAFWGNMQYGNNSANMVAENDVLSLSTLWYDNASDPDITYSYKYVDGQAVAVVKVPFNVKAGNVVFAVKNAAGTILWSWHLWITDYNPTDAVAGDLMDRNLGARSTGYYTSTGEGVLFYQFGRKDPFTVAVSNPVSATVSFATATNNPTIFYTNSGNWSSNGEVSGYWNDYTATEETTKSIFDPSPLGWKMPLNGVWSSYTNANTPWSATTYERIHTSGAVYPAFGCLSSSYASWSGNATSGYLWSATADSDANSRYMYFTSTDIYPGNVIYRAYGLPVCPVKE